MNDFTNSDAALGLDELREFRRQLRRIERSLARGLSGPGGPGCCGVSLAQCHALLGIAKLGVETQGDEASAQTTSPVSLSALGRELDIEPSTLTRTLDGLEQETYVLRRLVPGNRRSMEVAITEKGLSKVEEIDRLWNAWFAERLRSLGPDQLRQVREGVALLAEALKPESGEEPACC